jgi:hypothetical protein
MKFCNYKTYSRMFIVNMPHIKVLHSVLNTITNITKNEHNNPQYDNYFLDIQTIACYLRGFKELLSLFITYYWTLLCLKGCVITRKPQSFCTTIS